MSDGGGARWFTAVEVAVAATGSTFERGRVLRGGS